MIPLQLDSYNKITDSLEDPVVSFLEGNPRAVADWVEMQFTDEVINEYLPIIDQFKHGLLGISEHAVHLIESGRLDRTLSNFDRLNIIEPPEYRGNTIASSFGYITYSAKFSQREGKYI